MLQALRRLTSAPVSPVLPTSVSAQAPMRSSASRPALLAPVDQLKASALRGSVPAMGIRFATLTPPDVSSLEATLEIQLKKLEHVAPALHDLPDFSVTPLKIALEKDQQQVSFQLQNATLAIENKQGDKVLLEQLSGQFQARHTSGGVELLQDGRSLGVFQGTLKLNTEDESLQVNGARFRGDLRLIPTAGGFHVANDVMLEDYLKSVVPSESPASWPQQSLQAQAMAARTYAVANWGKHKASGFDMNDDTSDQVYKGMKTEHPGTQEAVKATTGQIITHGNKPITALFFSTSGGYTDSAKEVWGVDLPYIQPVKDFDQAASRYRWTLERSTRQIEQALEKLGHNVGAIQHIEPLTHTPQGRVKTLKVIGSRGSVTLNSNKFRFAARLYSTKWKVQKQGQNFVFNGGGWGHALGMSQWGARQMAADGYLAKDIVKHYYQGVDIQSLESDF